FMIMPFSSNFTVHNLGISPENLPMIYLVTGLASIFIGPLIGKVSDTVGNFKVFAVGSLLSMIMVVYYTNMGPSSLWAVMLVNVLMFVSIFSRMIPSQTMTSAIPDPASRGSFMSVSSSLQQIAGGFASVIAGLIVVQTPAGALEHFDTLGYVMVGTAAISLFLMYRIHLMVLRKKAAGAKV
ncbi:MAG: MFS transporter, partial [Proteobacteria bacterium]